MRFCQSHWSALRQKIADRGLDHLVPQGGAAAAQRMANQVDEKAVTRDNFDPLMGAHWAIVMNAMETLEKAGINPLYLMANANPPEGRNDCPVCELNYLHRTGCTNPQCTLDKETGYDFFLDLGADEQLERAREMKLVPPVQ